MKSGPQNGSIAGWCAVLLIVFLGLAMAAHADSRRTRNDAAVGAVLGAVAGQAIGKNTESTLIGAGAGLIFGGIHGHYRDRGAASNPQGPKTTNAPPVFEGIGAFPEYVETSDLYLNQTGADTSKKKLSR